MVNINETEFVKKQYKESDNLNTRISIHEKYSTNKLGLQNWYFTKYIIKDGMKILELGCGTAAMWINRKDVISRCGKLILSDFSEGMLKTAKENIGDYDNVEYKTIDIQNIPFEDENFDMVIANFMLYHVPDIDRAVSEVSRVLKKGGHFYAGTNGKRGVMPCISEMLELENKYESSFTLENGGDKIKPYFESVIIERYEDSLRVTDMDDLLDYIFSGIFFSENCTFSREEVREKLGKYVNDGAIILEKDPGMFVAVK